ncbi:MAG: hypothetical protein ACRC1K_25835, partial [Planctomycetia bacterium]
EGKIAAANVGKDPMYLFATLQRQLGYPEVPRLPKSDAGQHLLFDLERRVRMLEGRLEIAELELRGTLDVTKFYVKPDDQPRK